MTKAHFIIAAGIICGLTACHRAEVSHVPLQVKIEPAIKDGQSFVDAHNWCPDFPEDAFTAHATENGKAVGSIQYCATYGLGSAEGSLIRPDTITC